MRSKVDALFIYLFIFKFSFGCHFLYINKHPVLRLFIAQSYSLFLSLSNPELITMVHVIVVLFILVTQVSAYRPCPKCGKIKVPYPLSTDVNCGDPRYRIYCNNGALEFMSVPGFFYKILSINPKANKLIIKPPLIQEKTCYSSDLDQGGLMLDENLPFNISTRNTVMLFNCSNNILLSPLNCSSNSFCRVFEEVGEGRGCKGTLCCHFLKDSSMTSHRIRARLGGCTAYTSVVDKQPDEPIESWKFGIELQWLPPF